MKAKDYLEKLIEIYKKDDSEDKNNAKRMLELKLSKTE
ncbi:hypothetical protein ABID14_000367 [Peptoniphilus olsenii]|uniref:Uncharacterized protein n=1 Tax=Peptoniphilus olsenii TaxID=411570 RepID=A0ABV2J7K8_9FIRM